MCPPSQTQCNTYSFYNIGQCAHSKKLLGIHNATNMKRVEHILSSHPTKSLQANEAHHKNN